MSDTSNAEIAVTDSTLTGPTTKVDAAAIQAARVMVEAFNLAIDASDTTILNGILDGLVSLVDHDAVGVYIVDPTGKNVRHSLMRGCPNPLPELLAPFDQRGVLGDVLTSGHSTSLTKRPVVCEGRESAQSRLIVPLIGFRGRVRGAIDLWSDKPGGYDEQAATIVGIYATAVAAMVERARLYAEIDDKRQLDREFALARNVMEDLLPKNTPSLAGFDVAGALDASRAVGGDYYEFIPLGEDRWGVVIADVVGKGIAAALLVAATRASISSLVGHDLAMRAVMRRANRFFNESVEEGRHVTLFYMVLDVRAKRLLYVNAGHVPPVLVRANGQVELLEEGGVPLGLFENPRYLEGHSLLKPGDRLALYTDGIVEPMNAVGEEFGLGRLTKLLQQAGDASATEICSRVMQEVRRFGVGASQDDRTLVVIRSTS